MAKAVLVMDMPDDCKKCDISYEDDETFIHCAKTGEAPSNNGHQDGAITPPDWCPLIPEPGRQHREDGRYDCYADGYLAGTIDGWNDCLDTLEGKGAEY